MSVTEEELEALRKEAAEARKTDREERAKQAEEVAARTREIKAARLKRELGQGLEGADEVEYEDATRAPAPTPANPRTLSPPEPNKSSAVTPPREDSDTDDKSA